MISQTHLIIVLCGAGTFLLRFLPLWRNRRKPRGAAAPGPVQGFLQGIGPAAVSALLTVSLWPMVVNGPGVTSAAATLLALVAMYLVKKKMGGIAGPTLVGAAVYGALMHCAALL